jgi:hypothetical protein
MSSEEDDFGFHQAHFGHGHGHHFTMNGFNNDPLFTRSFLSPFDLFHRFFQDSAFPSNMASHMARNPFDDPFFQTSQTMMQTNMMNMMQTNMANMMDRHTQLMQSSMSGTMFQDPFSMYV